MSTEQQRLRKILMDTIVSLCKNSLSYDESLCIEGVIGITIDKSSVLLVHVNELIDHVPESEDAPLPKKTASKHSPSKSVRPLPVKIKADVSSPGRREVVPVMLTANSTNNDLSFAMTVESADASEDCNEMKNFSDSELVEVEGVRDIYGDDELTENEGEEEGEESCDDNRTDMSGNFSGQRRKRRTKVSRYLYSANNDNL